MSGKPHTKAITTRFLMLMDIVITNRINEVKSAQAFAELVGVDSGNLNRYGNTESPRYPTIEVICNVCLKFDVNPTWLLLGVGNPFNAKPAYPMANQALISAHFKPHRKKPIQRKQSGINREC